MCLSYILYSKLQTGLHKSRKFLGFSLLMPELYKVERIIGKRIRDSKFIEYKVKWQGYPTSQSTWEPIKHLNTVRNLIQEFQARNKDKLPPTSNLKLEHKPSKFGSTLQKKLQSDKAIPKVSSRKAEEPKLQKRNNNSKELRFKSKALTRLQESQQRRNQPEMSEIDIEDEYVDKIIETQQNNPQKDDNIFDGNLESIALRILNAVGQKMRQPKVVGIIKKLPEGSVYYQIEDSNGQQQYKNREYVMTHFSKELIEFYESRLPYTAIDQ